MQPWTTFNLGVHSHMQLGRGLVILLLLLGPAAGECYGQDREAPTKFGFVLLNSGNASIQYSRKGLEVESKDGNYGVTVRWRAQIRFADPFWKDPARPSDFGKPNVQRFGVRRARLKADGHAFRPWFTVQLEHDLVDNRLLNLATTVSRYEWLQVRAGLWKPEFNRERVTSSAKQEFVERSIVNTAFTIDRQPGLELLGRIGRGSPGDSWYYAGVFGGNGLNRGFGGDGHPMWMARYQWNPLGRDTGFSSGDLDYIEAPAMSFAVAGVTNRSRYTTFSSSGGGQLPGFSPGQPGQYSVRQALGEFAFKYQGLAIEQEFHYKRIWDNVTGRATNLRGNNVQAGYFLHAVSSRIPRQLEVGYRYGFVDPEGGSGGALAQEHTVGITWYFEGHNNKLAFDAGQVAIGDRSSPRVRIQWDVQF